MSFNFQLIKDKDSTLFTFFKLFLLLEVIMGHMIALSLPTFSQMNINSFEDVVLLFFKIAFSFGRESAYLFVFLSGFFTAKTFLNSNDFFELFSTIKTRIIRLYPTLIIAIFLTLFLDFFGGYYFHFMVYQSNGLHYNLNDHFSIYLFFTNLLSLEPTFSKTFGTNGPLWTLGYLVQFYIIAAILKKISLYTKYYFPIIFLIFIVLSWPLLGLEFSLLLLTWYIGMLARFINFKELQIKTLSLFAFIIVLLMLSRVSSKYISILLTPINAIVILYFIRKIPDLFLGIRFSTIPKIPDISYILYTVHMPLLFFVYGLFTYLFDNNFVREHYLAYIITGLISSGILSVLVLKLTQIKWSKK